jgi:3-hydroxyisobutyrate dehydrogenase
MTATIAFLGTGQMGEPMAHRLVADGHDVRVWNRTRARTDALAAAGAWVAPTPAAAATGAEVVITMLADPPAVTSVLFGPSGAAAGLRPGAVLVEMSTIGPAAVRELGRRLPAGVGLVDAPVSGGVGAAAAGALTILAGGEPSTVDRIAGVLGVLGTVRRCGGPGSGAALKLVGNAALLAGMAGLADTLAVADAVGVDRETALDLLAGGALGGAVRRATASGVGFAIALAHKDIDLALAALDPTDPTDPTDPGRRAAGRSTDAPMLRAAGQRLRDAPDQTADIGALIRPTIIKEPS